jgi:molybdate transport system ATP-binding protein
MTPDLEFRLDVALGDRRGGFRCRAAGRFPGGRIVGYAGSSGAGKTTLLRALAGLIRPAAGLIRFGDEAWLDTATGVDVPAWRRRAALVFQDQALFPRLTVEANVRYAAPDAEAAEQALRLAGLDGLRRRRPGELSGGQRQRVALARAVASRPRVLLLDEPFGALDDAARAELADELGGLLSRTGLTTVLVSHSRADLERLCWRVETVAAAEARFDAGAAEIRSAAGAAAARPAAGAGRGTAAGPLDGYPCRLSGRAPACAGMGWAL